MKQANLRRKWSTILKTGWSWGCVSAIDSLGRTIWIADAHRDGKRFVVRADEKVAAFLELEGAICAAANCLDKLARFFRNLPDMKTSIPPGLITFALVCLALVQNTQAVSPPPDGGYPGGNTTEGQNALRSTTTGASTLQLVTFRSLPTPPAVSILLLALERLTSTLETTIRPPVLQRFCSTAPARTTRPLE